MTIESVKDALQTNWNEVALLYSDNDELISKYWLEIVKKYSSGKRHYHNLNHLYYMVAKAIHFRKLIYDFDALLFSIFYHDLVYNVLRKDNEQKSADVATYRLAKLNFPADKIAQCRDQIIATRDHKMSQDEDTNFLVDFDLAILGESPEIYAGYKKSIRAEYSVYPDFMYNPGRKKVIQHFLSMDSIFKTEECIALYEMQARANLEAELNSL